MEKKYNTRSPAVKRLMREAAELSEATSDYYAAPLDDNLFEWHFTVRGPEGTDFEGGVYHGRIIVPAEYPMKPPDIILLTPTGRFVVGQKICLSISGYHPETWQPSWSIRTALLAIIGFMPTPGHGTIGSLDYTPQERQTLATRSISWQCSTCGCTPSELLPPPTLEVNTSQEQEVQDIIQSVILKSEEEMLKDKQKQKSKSEESTEVSSSTTDSSGETNVGVSQEAVVSPAEPAPVARPPTERLEGTTAALPRGTHTVEGSSNGFQMYDVVIFVIIFLIGALLFRRLAMMEYLIIEDSNGLEDEL